MTEPTTIKLKLLKFGAAFCGPCQAMARAQTLERFAAQHPELELKIFDLDKDEDDTVADKYGIQGIPAFVFETPEGEVVLQDEGATNITGLEKMLKKALEKLEEGNFGSVKRKKKKARASE